MGRVLMHHVVSVDGFIADSNDDVGPLHDWYFSGDTPLVDGLESDLRFRVSRASAAYVRPMWESIGVIVMGRHLFDLVNGWKGHPPAGDHVVVVSHRPKPEGWYPEAPYHFVSDVTAAIETAQKLAGDRTISVNAGDVGSQILAAGLIDEVAMDVVPVVFGSGKRYFGRIDGQLLLEDPDVVIQGARVLHLKYPVRR
ncbi:dihydrofolate reductase family protein [Cryptosporangium sp. NPDC048952]|uniref:dihydrofolate reductase family protein n=1 Tax=Cryptosporangium sp. NPDC048952 TaxID=3363961 RepID=UPI0037145FF6